MEGWGHSFRRWIPSRRLVLPTLVLGGLGLYWWREVVEGAVTSSKVSSPVFKSLLHHLRRDAEVRRVMGLPPWPTLRRFSEPTSEPGEPAAAGSAPPDTPPVPALDLYHDGKRHPNVAGMVNMLKGRADVSFVLSATSGQTATVHYRAHRIPGEGEGDRWAAERLTLHPQGGEPLELV